MLRWERQRPEERERGGHLRGLPTRTWAASSLWSQALPCPSGAQRVFPPLPSTADRSPFGLQSLGEVVTIGLSGLVFPHSILN